MSEAEQAPAEQRVGVANPVSVLGIVAFCGGLGSYLLCGLFIIVSAFFSGQYSNPVAQVQNASIIGTIAFLISIFTSLAGFVTGIVGVSIRRGQKLEGRGFAIAGLVMSGAYLLILFVLILIALLAVVFVGPWIDMFD